jgi:CheY-like chemotaxis protein
MAEQSAILLAEDDENDVFLVRRALEKAGLSNPLIVARDGQEAVDYLSSDACKQGGAGQSLPGLLLLDLKMPRLNGIDVLAWLSNRPELSELPVVVLSSSCHEQDREDARRLGADDYRVKPSDFPALVSLLKELHARWLSGVPQTG